MPVVHCQCRSIRSQVELDLLPLARRNRGEDYESRFSCTTIISKSRSFWELCAAARVSPSARILGMLADSCLSLAWLSWGPGDGIVTRQALQAG